MMELTEVGMDAVTFKIDTPPPHHCNELPDEYEHKRKQAVCRHQPGAAEAGGV
jgi:hypothetical protein